MQGCFFGAIFAFMFGEAMGRKKCIMLGCLVLCIGGALQASASTIPHMIVGRIVAGLGNGLNTSTIRAYFLLTETTDQVREPCR